MPILGKSGQSINERLFGREGFQLAGKLNPGNIMSRAKLGLATPGGFLGKAKEIALGPTAHASEGDFLSGGYSQGVPASFGPSSAPSSGGGSSTGANKTSSPSSGAARQQSSLEKLRKMQIEQINDAYKTEGKRLNKLTDITKNQYGVARQNLMNYQPQLESEKATQIEGLQNEENQRMTENRSALQQVRQMMMDQQRRAQAYLSATGNFSSSIVGPQSEMLARMGNQALSGVQKQREAAVAEIASKRRQVDDFFSRKSLELQERLQGLEQQHLAQLDQITNAKSASRAAKNKATVDAWQGYVQNRVAIENALMNTEAQWQAYSQEYGGQLESQLGDFVGSMDETDQISAPDELFLPGDTGEDEGGLSYNESPALRANILPGQPDEQSLLSLLMQQNSMA